MDDVEGLRWRSFVVVWWRSSLVEVFLNNGIVVSKVGKVIENKKKKTYLARDATSRTSAPPVVVVVVVVVDVNWSMMYQ